MHIFYRSSAASLLLPLSDGELAAVMNDEQGWLMHVHVDEPGPNSAFVGSSS